MRDEFSAPGSAPEIVKVDERDLGLKGESVE
jgi:hypothetical protein